MESMSTTGNPHLCKFDSPASTKGFMIVKLLPHTVTDPYFNSGLEQSKDVLLFCTFLYNLKTLFEYFSEECYF